MPSKVQNLRLEARAVRERWPISDDDRDAIIKRLMRTINDETASEREVASAAKALLAATAQNQTDEHRAADDLERTIFRLAEEFGLDSKAIEGATAGSQGKVSKRIT